MTGLPCSRPGHARGLVGIAALAGLCLPGAVHAQSIDPQLVVTGSRTGDTVGLTSLGTAGIADRQSDSLLDVLNDVPGVRAFSTGGPGGGSFLSVRGGQPNFTMVQLDGIRLNDPTNSAGESFDFTLLDPQLVQRIDVSRIADSAIYGSDALSGVVQIVPRDPASGALVTGAQAWVDTLAGSAASASATGGWGSGGAIVGLGHRDSGRGDPAGGLRRDQALTRFDQHIGDYRLSATVLYAHSLARDFPEDSGGPDLAIDRTLEQRRTTLVATALALRGNAEATIRPALSASWSHLDADIDTPAIAPGVLSGVPAEIAANRFTRLEIVADVAARLGVLTASAGAAVLREDGTSTGSIDYGVVLPVRFALTRVTHSGFAEASLRPLGGIAVNAALRYDQLAGGTGVWTGRGGVTWQPMPVGPTLFSHIANGYMLPSLYALGNPLVGDPALKPERSRAVEAGVEWQRDGNRLAFSAFDNRFHDLIDFDPTVFHLVNRDAVSARGIEAAATVALDHGWSLGGAVTRMWLDSTTPLTGRPNWNGNVHVAWDRHAWHARIAVRGNSAFDDSAIPTGAVVTPGHLAGDAELRWNATRHLDVGLAVLNMANGHWHDAVGTPALGRSVRLTLSVPWRTAS